MTQRIVKPDGTIEIVEEGKQGEQQQGQGQGQIQQQGQQPQQGEQKQQEEQFQPAGNEAERNLAFKTPSELRRYAEDVKIVNNMQVDDPVRFQQEHGFYPRRGSLDIGSKGLSAEDKLDVVAGRKRLEAADTNKGTFRAVAVERRNP